MMAARRKEMRKFMKKAKVCEKRRCLGNVEGQCCADSCRGAIIGLARENKTPETERSHTHDR